MIRYLKLFRFPLIFTAMADSASGYIVGLNRDHHEPINPVVMALLAVASGGLYAFGMACNDIADRARDRMLHPDRVLPSGRLTPAQAYAAATLVLVLSAAAVLCLAITASRSTAAIGVSRLVIWTGVAVFILLYDFGSRKAVLTGAILMGLIRGGDFMLGLVYAPTTSVLDRGLFLYAGVLLLYVLCLTLVSTLEEGAPRRGFFKLVAGGMLVSPIAAGAVGWLIVWTFYAPAVAAAVLLILWIGARTWAVLREFSRRNIARMVRDGVMGIILLDASIVLWSGRVIEGAAVAGLVLPAAACVWWFRRL